MLFEAQTVCAPLFVRELDGQGGETVLEAPLVAALVSRGHAAAQGPAGKAAGLPAGGVLLGAGLLTVTPGSDCHLLCAGLTGPAAQAAAAGLAAHERLLAADGAVCPGAAEALAALQRAAEAGAPEALCRAACGVVCAVMHADEAPSRAALPQLVSEAVLAIRQNYAELYGAEELSRQLGVSKSHLVRVFSAAMGMGPGQYLTMVRLDAAKAMLAGRDWPLEVIAPLCGFSGANYFCKVFKKHTGLTPGAWRAQNAGTLQRADALEAREKAMYV